MSVVIVLALFLVLVGALCVAEAIKVSAGGRKSPEIALLVVGGLLVAVAVLLL